MGVNSGSCRHQPAAPLAGPDGIDRLRAATGWLPRPARFLAVGSLGLVTDIGIFTLFYGFGVHPLVARALSLSVAMLVTWRLNRAVTFDSSGRQQHKEAMRYAAVTAAAQGTSYAVFAVLALTVLAALPQAAHRHRRRRGSADLLQRPPAVRLRADRARTGRLFNQLMTSRDLTQ